MDNEVEFLDGTIKILPIGTIVILKNGWKKIMITGHSQINMETKEEIFDYIGCLYPEGVISSEANILFNNDDIKEIISFGLMDDEQKNYLENSKILLRTEKEKEEVLNKANN